MTQKLTYRQLQEYGSALPTIIVRVYAAEQAQSLYRLRSLSVAGVLNKPFEPQDFL